MRLAARCMRRAGLGLGEVAAKYAVEKRSRKEKRIVKDDPF